MKQIAAGYRLIVTSWENDADNYRTESVEGLTKEGVTLLVALIKLFRSESSGGHGNLYEPSDAEIKKAEAAIQVVLDKHPDVKDKQLKDYITDPEGVMEFLYDLGMRGGGYWSRVLDKFEVEHFPQNVTINDVTKEFS